MSNETTSTPNKALYVALRSAADFVTLADFALMYASGQACGTVFFRGDFKTNREGFSKASADALTAALHAVSDAREAIYQDLQDYERELGALEEAEANVF